MQPDYHHFQKRPGLVSGLIAGIALLPLLPGSVYADPIIDTFHVLAAPNDGFGPRPLKNASLLVMRSNGAGGFNISQAFLGLDNDNGVDFLSFDLDVSLTRPEGFGPYGYAVLALYTTSPEDPESGVVVGVNPEAASGMDGHPFNDQADPPDVGVFSGTPEVDVFGAIGTTGVDTASLSSSFLQQLFDYSAQTEFPIGDPNGAASISLTMEAFSIASPHGPVTLSFNAVPEIKTSALGIGLLGFAGWMGLRARRR